MRKDEVQDFKDPGCGRDIMAGLFILMGTAVGVAQMFYGVVTWS